MIRQPSLSIYQSLAGVMLGEEKIPYCDGGYEYNGQCCEPARDCEPGTYGFGRFNRCKPCAPGTFNPYYGATACHSCPINTVAPHPGSTECTPCPGGTTSDNGIACLIVCNFPTTDPVAAPVHPPVEPPVEPPVTPPVSPPNRPPFWCQTRGDCEVPEPLKKQK